MPLPEPSSSRINYSLRPNKAIERALVFEGLARLVTAAPGANYLYVGFGSAWFVDFDQAHRDLGIDTMISIESDEVTFERAKFNRPYRTVEVVHGVSDERIPELLERPDLDQRPWILWLDYDGKLDGDKVDELLFLADELPDDSIVLCTFNAHPGSYGSAHERRLQTLSRLLGDAFDASAYEDDEASLAKGPQMQRAMADAVLAMLSSRVRERARPGGFVPAVRLAYQDGAPMVTVGGVLPRADHANDFSALAKSEVWRCMSDAVVATSALTSKEVSALRTLLPTADGISREDLRALGFDLRDDHLDSFVRYYREYPTYVQVGR